MSFATEIYNVMISDSSLNSYVDGGIHSENLKDNWLAETNYDKWIVYDHNKSAQGDCMNSKNIYMTYSLSVLVIQRDTNDEIDIITDRLIEYLNNHESGNIYDIGFISDSKSFNQQQNIYSNTLEFVCTYFES